MIAHHKHGLIWLRHVVTQQFELQESAERTRSVMRVVLEVVVKHISMPIASLRDVEDCCA